MKRNSLRQFIFILCLYITVYYIFMLSPKANSALVSPPRIIFPVISDIHIGGSRADLKFQETLRQCEEIYPSYDAIAIVGDITDQGKETQYDTFMRILKLKKPSRTEAIVAMGNHEYGKHDSTDKVYEDTFVKKTGMPGIYYDKWIKGYHFIVIAPESRLESEYHEKQFNWLNNKLEESEDISKPIFVFLHQPFPNTVYGSNSWGQVLNYKKIFSALKAHPQVIFFSGHSHYSLEHPRTIYKKGFTMFNTGAVYYIMTGDDEYCNYELNQGLFVEVYDKEVRVRCREFSKQKWIGKVYIIKTWNT